MTKSDEILVTGAAGFIGSHVCEKMLKKGHKVIGIDNLNNYYDLSLKESNLRVLEQYDKFLFHKQDITDFSNLQYLFQNYSFNIIIHLAAQAGVRYSLVNPFIYHKVNVGGTLNLLELAKRYRCKKFSFTSSSSVYGNQSKTPFSEEDPVFRPISVYAATKQAGEALCYTYHHLYSINVNCLRLFTVYGPRNRPDMSSHIFTKAFLKKENIRIFDTQVGTIKRDFSFISDIVEGIVCATNFWDGFQIYNLGYGSPIKLMDFITILEDITGISVKIEYGERQPGDVDVTYADISKAKRYLGFSPKINIQKGLEIYVDWFKKYYSPF